MKEPEVVFDLPTADTPGFLKRQRAAVAMQQELVKNPVPESIDKVVEFLLPFVKEPEDRDAAREAIWDLPQSRFKEVLAVLTESQTPPKS